MAKKVLQKPAQRWARSYIREWRNFRGLSLAELALRMNYNEGYLSELENGHKRYNQDVLEAAAQVLDVPIAWLLSRKPPLDGSESPSPDDVSEPDRIADMISGLDPKDRRRIAAMIENFRQISEE